MTTDQGRFADFRLPPLEQRCVWQVLQRAAEDRPDAIALRDPNSSLSYAQLFDRATRAASGFKVLGVEQNEHVLIMLDNHLDAVVVWLGLAFLGAVEVPVNTAYRGELLNHVLRDSRAQTMVIEDHYLDRLEQATEQPDRVIVRGGGHRERSIEAVLHASGHELVRNHPWDTLAVFYTSGTTGASKGVIIPEAQAYGYAAPMALRAALADDVSYVSLPLFHVGGQFYGVYNALIGGATAVIPPAFSASGFWPDVHRYGATFSVLTGAMISFLLARPPSELERTSPIRAMVFAPPPANVDEVAARFGVRWCTGYGSTEAGAPLVAPDGGSRSRTIGWVRPGYSAKVVDEHDREVPDGTLGELVVRPEEPWTMMAGYLGLPEQTAEAWRNGWFHTGDAVRRNEDGEFFLEDRLRDSIRRRGENISSIEVEAAVNAHPAVLESAVVGVPSEHGESEVLAVVTPSDTIDPAELVIFLADRLPYFMVPRYIRFADELERTGSNKLKKEPLRAVGLTEDTWDRERHGIQVTRDGVRRKVSDNVPD